jgi:hypothetical protein
VLCGLPNLVNGNRIWRSDTEIVKEKSQRGRFIRDRMRCEMERTAATSKGAASMAIKREVLLRAQYVTLWVCECLSFERSSLWHNWRSSAGTGFVGNFIALLVKMGLYCSLSLASTQADTCSEVRVGLTADPPLFVGQRSTVGITSAHPPAGSGSRNSFCNK